MKQTNMRQDLNFHLVNAQVVNLNCAHHSKNILIICNESSLQGMA